MSPLATWFLLQDRASPSPYQSGLYFQSSSIDTARAKPMVTSFRFPFVALLDKAKVNVWGRDATSDRRLLTIAVRHGARGRWRTVARIRSNNVRDLQGDAQARGVEERLASGAGARVGLLAGGVAEGAETVSRAVPGATDGSGRTRL